MARGIIQLTDGRGRKYLTAEERERFLATAARVFLSRMWGEGPAPRLTKSEAMLRVLEDDMEARPGVYRRLAAS